MVGDYVTFMMDKRGLCSPPSQRASMEEWGWNT